MKWLNLLLEWSHLVFHISLYHYNFLIGLVVFRVRKKITCWKPKTEWGKIMQLMNTWDVSKPVSCRSYTMRFLLISKLQTKEIPSVFQFRNVLEFFSLYFCFFWLYLGLDLTAWQLLWPLNPLQKSSQRTVHVDGVCANRHVRFGEAYHKICSFTQIFGTN